MFSLNLDILPMTCFSNNNNKTTKEGKGYLIQGFLSEPMLIDNNYLSFSILITSYITQKIFLETNIYLFW